MSHRNRSWWPQVVIGAMLVASVLSASTAQAQTKTWDGGAATLSWHDAANWNPDGVPGAGDDVLIDVPASVMAVTYSTGLTSINSFTCNEDFNLSGGTLTIAAQSQVNGVMVMSSGVLDGAGDLVIANRLSWTGGTLGGPGKLFILSGAAFDMEGTGFKTFTRPIFNNGDMSWRGSGSVSAGANIQNIFDESPYQGRGGDGDPGDPTFNIDPCPGARFGITGPYTCSTADDLLQTASTRHGAFPCNPLGSGEGDAAQFHMPMHIGHIGPPCTLEVVSGSLTLAPGSSIAAGSSIVVHSGALLVVNDPVTLDSSNLVTLHPAAHMDFGTLTVQSGEPIVMNPGSEIRFGGATTFESGSELDVTSGSRIIINGVTNVMAGSFLHGAGTLQIGGQALYANSPITIANLVVNNPGPALNCNVPQSFTTVDLGGFGSIRGPASFTVTGTMNWTGGSIDGTVLKVASGAVLNIYEWQHLLFGSLENHGTINHHWGSVGLGYVFNASDGVINLANWSPVIRWGWSGGYAFENEGQINVTEGSRFAIEPGTYFSNSGSINFASGADLFINTPTVTQYVPATGALTGGTYNFGSSALMSIVQSGNPRTIRELGANTAIKLEGVSGGFPLIDSLTAVGSGASFELGVGRDFAANPVGGTFTNSGTLKIGTGCDFDITGDYSQTATGTLDVTFGAPAETPLNATGSLALDGTILALASPYPTGPATFTAASGASRSGTFASALLTPNGAMDYTPTAANWNAWEPGDINGDGAINVTDLLSIIGGWGNCPAQPTPCPNDVAPLGPPIGDGQINVGDLLLVISNWG